MNKNSKKILYVVIFLLVLSLISIIASNKDNLNNSESLNILSSYDNADLEDNIKNYVKKYNIKVKFTYMGDLDILYMTRVQKERFFNEADYIRLKDYYILKLVILIF